MSIKFTMNRKPSKSGKRTMFFPTINGKRLNGTNYGRKWEAERLVQNFVDHYGRERLIELCGGEG